MELLFVILPALLLGGGLIWLLKKFPPPERERPPSPEPSPFQRDLLALSSDALAAFLTEVVEKGGHLLLEAPQTEPGSLLLRVNDPNPLAGGPYLLRFHPRGPGSPLGPAELADFSHLVRSAELRKGILMTSAEVDPRVIETAQSGPIEVLDGGAFEALCLRLGAAPRP